MIASIHTRPSVSGTNRKWYSAVSANCRRDRVTTVGSIMRGLRGGGCEQMSFDRGGRGIRPWLRREKHVPDHHKQRDLDHDDQREFNAETMPPTAAEPGASGGWWRDIHGAHQCRTPQNATAKAP